MATGAMDGDGWLCVSYAGTRPKTSSPDLVSIRTSCSGG